MRDLISCTCAGYQVSLAETDKVCKHAGVWILISLQTTAGKLRHLDPGVAAKNRNRLKDRIAAARAQVPQIEAGAQPETVPEPRVRFQTELTQPVSPARALAERIFGAQSEVTRPFSGPFLSASKDSPPFKQGYNGILTDSSDSDSGTDETFVGYDTKADDAVEFLPRKDAGRLMALMRCKQTHKLARYLIRRQAKQPRQGHA